MLLRVDLDDENPLVDLDDENPFPGGPRRREPLPALWQLGDARWQAFLLRVVR